MQQSDRSEVDVEVESESEPKQNVACVLVARHARITHRTEKNGVYVALKVLERGIRERFSRLEVVISGIG